MTSIDIQLIEILKTMILDAQDAPVRASIPRQTEITSVPNKAAVCIGVRRCGKSTLMEQIRIKLEKAGVAKECFLSINLVDDRLHNLTPQSLGLIIEAYFAIYPEKKNVETVHIFLDEIQTIDGWESFIDRIMRTERCQIYLTGSSSRMLSKEIATQMRGRSLSWELFPFSFREYLGFKQLKISENISTKQRLLVQKAFDEYWQSGGFPEVLKMVPALRIKIHQEYKQTILLRDLIDRHDIAHPKAVIDLAHWLIDNNGALYSVNNLTNYLKSLGHKVAKSSVGQYIEWFEDAYFLFSVRIFDASLTRSNANPKKIYCIDHALVTSIASGILVNSGRLLENLVFLALRRQHTEIYYYRTTSGKEVDFIVIPQSRQRMLIQVCETLADSKTRKREIDALAEAMKEQKIKQAVIVSRDEDEVIETDYGTIQVLSAWRYLLNLEI